LIFNQDQDLCKINRTLITKDYHELRLEEKFFAAQNKKIESMITPKPKKELFISQ